MYIKMLQWLCRRQLRKIADKYPHTPEELIRYYDFMAIECANEETPTKARILGISLSTVKAIEAHNKAMNTDKK